MDKDLVNQYYNYVDKNKKSYIEYFCRCRSPLLYNYYAEFQKDDLIASVKREYKYLEQLHNLFLDEIDRIYNFSVDKGIRLVGLKGMFLNDDIYDNPNIFRMYHDIDLFIHNCDTAKLAEYFINAKDYKILDYKAKFFQILFDIFKSDVKRMTKMDISKINHLVLNKFVSHNELDYEIIIEIHTNFNILKLSKFDNDLMIDNSVLKTMKDGRQFYVLNELDNLLFLCHHLIRHLPYVYQDCMGPIFINIDKILDIALFLKKHRKILSDKKILEASIAYEVLPYTGLSLYLINDIFPGILKDEFVQDLLKRTLEQDFSWKKIFIKLLKHKPIDIISGNLYELPEILNAIDFIEKKLGPFEEFTKNRTKKIIVWHMALKLIK